MDERMQQLLESPDARERADGLRLVALFEDQDAAPLALALLERDPSPEVREFAARAAGFVAIGKAAQALERSTTIDGDAIVRRTAVVVLGELGDREASAALGRLAPRMAPQDRLAFLEAVRSCGDPALRETAASFAASEDVRTRAIAVQAAAALSGSELAKPSEPLAAAAKTVLESGPVWATAGAALVLGQDAAAAVVRAAPLARGPDRERVVLRALELPEEPCLAVLRCATALPERSPEDRPARLVAARELARRGDAAGSETLARALYDGEARTRIDAACALAELGCSIGEPVLLKTLPRASAGERAAISRGLALCGRTEGVRSLGALLSSDVPQDRRAAALAFAELGRRDGATELARTLDFPFRRERLEALAALGKLWSSGPRLAPLAVHAERAPVASAWLEHFARS